MATMLLQRRVLLPLTFILFICCTSSQAQQPTIEVVTEVDWSEKIEDANNKGSLVNQISTLVLERMGYQVNTYFTPWARALKVTEDGKADGVAGIYYTEQRAESLIFTDPITIREIVLFKRKDRDIVYNGDLKELAGYKIGVVRDYTYGELFDNASYLNKVVSVKPGNNLRLLLAERVDLIIGSRETMKFLLKQQHPQRLGEIIALTPIVKKQEVYFAFSKKLPEHERIVHQFNRVLSELKNDGSITKLENKYALAKLTD